MIKNILFPTDYSESSKNALPFAIDLAKKNDARLFFIHVYKTPLVPPSSIFRTSEQTMAYTDGLIIESAKKRMKELLKSENLKDLPHNQFIVEGDVQHEIQKIVANSSIDMVVMGTKGETADRELFMGSVAKNLIEHLRCPVLAIPGDCIFGNIEQIVFATDLKEDETNAIEYLVKIAALNSSTLTLLHFDTDPRDKPIHVEKLKKMLSKTDYSKIRYEEIVVDDILMGFEYYMKQHSSMMLAMTTKTTSFFDKIFHQSLTKEILFHTHIPILGFNKKSKGFIVS